MDVCWTRLLVGSVASLMLHGATPILAAAAASAAAAAAAAASASAAAVAGAAAADATDAAAGSAVAAVPTTAVAIVIPCIVAVRRRFNKYFSLLTGGSCGDDASGGFGACVASTGCAVVLRRRELPDLLRHK